MNGGENKIVTHSATQLPNGGKQPVSNKLVIAVVSLAILTFLGILSETSLNIAYSTPMEEFSIGASVVQWLVTGYLLLLSVSIPSSPFMVRKFATKTLFIMAIVIFIAGRARGQLPDAARRPTGHVARYRHLPAAYHQHPLARRSVIPTCNALL